MSFTHPIYVGHFERPAITAGQAMATTQPLDEVAAHRLLTAAADRHVDGVYHVGRHRFVVGPGLLRCLDWFPTSTAAAELIAVLADTLACDIYDWDAHKLYGSVAEFREFARWAVARWERRRSRHPPRSSSIADR